MRSSCIQKSFFGCSAIFLFFVTVTILLLVSSNLPEFRFTSPETESKEYVIGYDKLSNEKIINATFSWKLVDNRLKKKKFQISFKLLEKDVREAMDYIEMISTMSYKELGLERNYGDPMIEARVVWAEVYRRVFYYSAPKMNTVIEGFDKIFSEENFDDRDKVYFMITFVQNIRYDRPGGDLDLFPPLGTLAYRFGDCDSKAMLLYVILERMNVDCAMLWSYYYKHAMLGIKVNGRGNFLTANGKNYYFLETTYPNWNVGEIPPEFSNTKFWFISEIDAEKGNKQKQLNGLKESLKPSPAIPE